MRQVQVGEIVDIVNGYAFDSSQFNTKGRGLPIVRIRDVVPGISHTYTTQACPDDYLVNDGDLLIGMDGEFNIETWQGGRALLNQRVCKVRSKPGIADDTYIKYRLAVLLKQMEANTPFVTVKHLSSRKLEQEWVILLPLPEQKRIAGLLARADRVRRLRRAARERGAGVLQAVFLEMFGDPVGNPRGWRIERIKNLISDLRGGSPLKPTDFRDLGFPVLHKGALKPGGIVKLDTNKKTFTHSSFVDKHKRSVIDRTYMAVTLRDLIPSGPSIGLMSKLDKSPYPAYILAQGAYAFRVDEQQVLPEYFVWISNIESFRRYLRSIAVGSTQIHIRTPIFTRIPVPVPTLDSQQRFAEVVHKYERIRAQQREAERQAEQLFAALLARAFQGKG